MRICSPEQFSSKRQSMLDDRRRYQTCEQMYVVWRSSDATRSFQHKLAPSTKPNIIQKSEMPVAVWGQFWSNSQFIHKDVLNDRSTKDCRIFQKTCHVLMGRQRSILTSSFWWTKRDNAGGLCQFRGPFHFLRVEHKTWLFLVVTKWIMGYESWIKVEINKLKIKKNKRREKKRRGQKRMSINTADNKCY